MSEFFIWEGVHQSFDQAEAEGPGFDGQVWRQRTGDAFVAALSQWDNSGTVPDFIIDRGYQLPVVMAAQLSVLKTRLRVLDVGGGLGTAWLAAASVLGGAMERVDFQVMEVPNICAAAQQIFAGRTDTPGFVSDLPSACVDLIHAGSVVQYISDWRSFIAAIARLAPATILMSDMFAGPQPSFASRQNYYGSKIPHWFLNQDEFMAEMDGRGYALLASTPYHARLLGRSGPLPMDNFPPQFRLKHTSHLLFARKDND